MPTLILKPSEGFQQEQYFEGGEDADRAALIQFNYAVSIYSKLQQGEVILRTANSVYRRTFPEPEELIY